MRNPSRQCALLVKWVSDLTTSSIQWNHSLVWAEFTEDTSIEIFASKVPVEGMPDSRS